MNTTLKSLIADWQAKPLNADTFSILCDFVEENGMTEFSQLIHQMNKNMLEILEICQRTIPEYKLNSESTRNEIEIVGYLSYWVDYKTHGHMPELRHMTLITKWASMDATQFLRNNQNVSTRRLATEIRQILKKTIEFTTNNNIPGDEKDSVAELNEKAKHELKFALIS